MKKLRVRQFAAAGLAALLVLLPAPVASQSPSGNRIEIPDTGLAENQRILHALNRLAYGPRPGDIERVRRMGLVRWIEQQLFPERIPDAKVERLLEPLTTLQMTQAAMMRKHPPPPLLRQLEQRLTSRMGMDADAAAELFPELAAARERQRQRERAESMGGMEAGAMAPAMEATPERTKRGRNRSPMDGPQQFVLELSQARLLRALHSERQLQEIMTDFWFNHFNVFAGKTTNRWLVTGFERDTIRPHALGRFRDLLGATARHPAMLVYLDNWQSADPEAEQDGAEMEAAYRKTAKEAGLPRGGVAAQVLRDRGLDPAEFERRSSVRRRAAGRGMGRGMRRGGSRPNARRRILRRRRPRRGLNENYARELLELHTLGVDGGYTQKDVIEVARCFTGWSLTPLPFGQHFVYVDAMHDKGTKTVLGRQLRNDNRRDGERVLDLLAGHPSTARFISTKLARRFVSDEPPEPLIAAMAGTFEETGGDIREVLRTLFGSKEFWAPEAVNAKHKTPLMFVASAARAAGMRLEEVNAFEAGNALRLVMRLRVLGQPLYGAQPPTGYQETAEAWVSTGGMLQRIKLSAAFAAGRLAGIQPGERAVRFDAATVDGLVQQAGIRLLGRELAPPVREALRSELERMERILRRNPKYSDSEGVPGPLEPLAAAWVLASPEFQRH